MHIQTQNLDVELLDMKSGIMDDESTRSLIFASKVIFALVPVLLLTIGIPGNILTILTFRRRRLKDNVLSRYLIVMAVYNILTLVTTIPRLMSLGLTGYDYYKLNSAVCFYQMWLVIYTMSGANWTLVLVTAMRMFHLLWLKKCQCMFTKTFFWILVIGVQLFLAIFHYVVTEYRIIIVKYKNNSAHHSDRLSVCEESRGSIAAVIQVTVFCFLPYLCLVSINAVTLYHFVFKKSRSNLIKEGNLKKRRRKAEQHLALMVALSDIQFLITVFPSAINFLISKSEIGQTISDHEKAEHRLWEAIATMLLLSNYSTNIFLYCLFGSRFREELKTIVQGFFGQGKTLFRGSTKSSTAEYELSHSSDKIKSVVLSPVQNPTIDKSQFVEKDEEEHVEQLVSRERLPSSTFSDTPKFKA